MKWKVRTLWNRQKCINLKKREKLFTLKRCLITSQVIILPHSSHIRHIASILRHPFFFVCRSDYIVQTGFKGCQIVSSTVSPYGACISILRTMICLFFRKTLLESKGCLATISTDRPDGASQDATADDKPHVQSFEGKFKISFITDSSELEGKTPRIRKKMFPKKEAIMFVLERHLKISKVFSDKPSLRPSLRKTLRPIGATVWHLCSLNNYLNSTHVETVYSNSGFKKKTGIVTGNNTSQCIRMTQMIHIW